MIKIKIYELDKHRNETTFRPYVIAQNIFREIGVQFTDGDSYDLAWVGQASIANKKVSLNESIEQGLNFLNSIKGPYYLFDGQDSTSLIGTYEILKESNALLLLKNSLLKDRSLYSKGWVNGRYYWGEGNYLPQEFDKHSDKIKLSGTNWLSTVQPKWHPYDTSKLYDVAALFSYPSLKDVYEHELHQSKAYDNHRKPCIDILRSLKVNVVSLENGVKLPPQEYYNKMYNSKIILAPFGYGEMAPRDIEAVMFGSILLKPDMSHIDSEPMWYEDGKTYIACKHDYSDVPEKVDYILSNYARLQKKMTEYARKKFQELYLIENRVLHMYNILKTLPFIQ